LAGEWQLQDHQYRQAQHIGVCWFRSKPSVINVGGFHAVGECRMKLRAKPNQAFKPTFLPHHYCALVRASMLGKNAA
jgi:hypothetical protein